MAAWKISGVSVGAVVSSLLTLGCCLPLPFLGAAGLAGASVFLAGARPWMLGISIVLLVWGFFQVYRAIGTAFSYAAGCQFGLLSRPIWR
jgi:hypothetical protein